MTDRCDKELLSEYVAKQSEIAFEMLVGRYMNLVYSTALRHVGNGEDAKEITQAVFILLAQKATGLKQEIVLSGWLYQTTRLTSMTFLRNESRRRRREEEASVESMENNTNPQPDWPTLASGLDGAMAKLNDKERTAIVLRFLEGRTFAEIATILGQNQSAIQKRVDRALEKLRVSFVRRGVTISAAALAGAMVTNSAAAAPASMLSSVIASSALSGAAGHTSAYLLTQQAAGAYMRLKLKSAATALLCLITIAGATAFLLNWSGVAQRMIASRSNTLFELRSAGLNHGAPWVFIGSNSVTTMIGTLGTNKTDAGVLVPVVWLVGHAYEISPARMTFPMPWPRDDCSYFPADFSETQRANLRRILQDTYRLTAKRRTQPTDVLKMVVKTPEADGLRVSSGAEPDVNLFTQRGVFSGTNVPMSVLCGILENYLARPVIDQTGLTNHYDFRVTWNQQRNEAGAEALIAAVREQLGIELAPDRARIDTLVVEQIQR